MALHGRRIGLLTASASRAGGGVFEAVVAQAAMIRAGGGEAIIFALADEYSEADRARFAPSIVHLSAVSGPAQVGYAPGLIASLLAADLDCLHLHGIWMYPSHAGARWAQQTSRPYLISPHGMLDPWITARGRWKKALARAGYERASWRAASAFHGLTAGEAEDIRREAGRGDTIVIANAGPAVAPPDPAMRAAQIVYIGRIHPKKNLLALVAAWRLAAKPDGCTLTIAGWGEADDIAALRAAIGNELSSGIHFAGPIFGAAKQALLASARFVILPSLSEGLPMAILEGWAAGAPAIMTTACNLPEGFAAGAALACGTDAGSIAEALTAALRLDEPRWQAMASAARTLAAGPFAAETVAARWVEAYSSLMAPAALHERTHEPA
ncbi:MAG: glycosyltransferase [Pseudomonadota bacterium]|nr:glycosyltransferase [Pseudomonadota bacterium]